jgi:hypothetical protein
MTTRPLSSLLVGGFVACSLACEAPSALPDSGINLENEGKLLASPVGEPDGEAVQAEIGADGGTLSTDDGRFILTVPAGALAAKTRLSVRPIVATAPGAAGLAVRLEKPAGVEFSQPVTVSFRLTAFELAGADLQSLGVGFQNAQGFWEKVPATWSAAAQTLSATTSHFSDWSALVGRQLEPGSASVQVGKTVTLTMRFCNEVSPDQQPTCRPGEGTPCLVAQCRTLSLPGSDFDQWSVNGNLGGNSQTGTVVQNGPGAVFTAPSKKPDPNQVAVSVRYAVTDGQQRLLVSNITITDDPEYSGEVFFGGGVNGLFAGDGALGLQRFEDLADVARYRVVRGEFYLSFTYPDCEPVRYLKVPVTPGGELVVRKSKNALGKTHFWSTTTMAVDVPLRCGSPRETRITPILMALNPEQAPYQDARELRGKGRNMSLGGKVAWVFESPNP